MKVFDFTNGQKGKLLGEARRPSWMLGWLTSKGFVVKLAKKNALGITFGLGAGWTEGSQSVYLNPREYGVEAICFCVGEWTCGEDTAWEWRAIGTRAWVKNAIHTGLLTSTKMED